MKKRIVFFLSLAVAAGIAAASVPDKKIVVRSQQGSAEYAVADIMSLKFGNGDVYMNMNDGSVVNWAAGGIDMMSFLYYEPSPETGIGENCVQSFSILGGFIVITSSAPVKVTLTTIDGRSLFAGYCNGELRLPVQEYPAGVYLLSINGAIHKIMNR